MLTMEQAARILDPRTSKEFINAKGHTFEDIQQACKMGAEALEVMKTFRFGYEVVLAPCGCGGAAEFCYTEDEKENDMCYVFCTNCRTRTNPPVYTEVEARYIWNRAVGKGEKWCPRCDSRMRKEQA